MTLTARSSSSYRVPLVRPFIVNEPVVSAGSSEVQNLPPSKLYSWLLSGRPPSAPRVKVTETVPSPGVATRSVGASGSVGPGTGVTSTALDSAPAPAALTARRRMEAATLLASPATVTGEEVSAGENAVHAPLSTLYS